MSYPLLPTCSVHLVGVRWKTLWKREREGKRSGPQVYLAVTKILVQSKTFFRNEVSQYSRLVPPKTFSWNRLQ